MDQKTYINDRVDDQINYYERRSGDYQKQYRRYRVTEILAASMIPFLSGYLTSHPIIPYIVGLLGVLIAVVSALDALYRPQEHWTEYRTTGEKLKQEKFLFDTQTAPYGGRDSFQQFVKQCESILSGEVNNWQQSQQEQARQRAQAAQAGRQQPAAKPAAARRPDAGDMDTPRI